jgi:hypothetical protein
MPDGLSITIKGMDEVIAALDRFPKEIYRYMVAAGKEAGSRVISTRGLKRYPPATEANVPPVPFYIRGMGTQYATRNLDNSEHYGSNFYVKASAYGAEVGNTETSYAKYLGGDEQAGRMAKIGWRKLLEVAQEKVGLITDVYERWVAKLIKDLGLR